MGGSVWYRGLAAELDVVMVLTAGSHHAPPTIAAAQAGRHVFVEKPMGYTLREADAMIAVAERAGVVLMVGNVKRFDPAYEHAIPLVAAVRDLRLARITTLEATLLPYVQPQQLMRVADIPADTLAALRSERQGLLREALGPDASREALKFQRAAAGSVK